MPEINLMKPRSPPKTNWAVRIIALIVIIAAIVLGVVFRKQLGDFLESFVDWVSFAIKILSNLL